MKTRPLNITDLPKHNPSGKSLHIPVILKNEGFNKIRFICDLHYNSIRLLGNTELVYLEGCCGVPTKISNLEIIIASKKEVTKFLNKIQTDSIKFDL